jgi:hypothetical protein
LDWLSDGGGLVALPGSVGPKGAYREEPGWGPDEASLGDPPEWLLKLIKAPAGKSPPNGTPDGHPKDVKLPVGRAAKEFVEKGTPLGQQRTRACAAARNFLSAGHSVQETAELLWQGFDACHRSGQVYHDDPWKYEDALAIARDIAKRPPRPPTIRNEEDSLDVAHVGDKDRGESLSTTPTENERDDPPGESEKPKDREETRRAARGLFPIPPGVTPVMTTVAMRRKTDAGLGVLHKMISNTWRNEANAQHRRRGYFVWFKERFEEHVRYGGCIYKVEIPIPPGDEGSLQAKKCLEALSKKVKRMMGLLRWFHMSYTGKHDSPVLEGVLAVYITVEVEGAALLADLLGDLVETLRLTAPSQLLVGQRRPRWKALGGSREWDIKHAETQKWECIGWRRVDDIQDQYDEREAVDRGLETWEAGDDELAARAADLIVASRHIRVPKLIPDPGERAYLLLDYLDAVGIRLRSSASKELDRGRLRWEKRAA